MRSRASGAAMLADQRLRQTVQDQVVGPERAALAPRFPIGVKHEVVNDQLLWVSSV